MYSPVSYHQTSKRMKKAQFRAKEQKARKTTTTTGSSSRRRMSCWRSSTTAATSTPRQQPVPGERHLGKQKRPAHKHKPGSLRDRKKHRFNKRAEKGQAKDSDTLDIRAQQEGGEGGVRSPTSTACNAWEGKPFEGEEARMCAFETKTGAIESPKRESISHLHTVGNSFVQTAYLFKGIATADTSGTGWATPLDSLSGGPDWLVLCL